VTKSARVPAPAKVNLRLRVLARRPDGYHDLDTLFQAIDLTDEVGVELRGERIELDVRGADLGAPEGNLAYRAAAGLATSVGYDGGIRVRLTKRIPAGAGLGGGSSDAAAVLRCLARLLNIPHDDRRMRTTAEGLGSDVPFFLCGSALARGSGRGEVLEPLRPLPTADLVLVSPPVHVSTAAAYAALGVSRTGGSVRTPRPVAAPSSWDDVASSRSNDFQPLMVDSHPEIDRALDALHSAGARFALMSGSGSSVFGLFASTGEARRVAEALTTRLGWPCRAVRTLPVMPDVEVS
jgi:4-diphosphocytidyl-2-C-methyl-D-erythritol kinase